MGVLMSVYCSSRPYLSRPLIIKEEQGNEKTSRSESPRLKNSQMKGANSPIDHVNKEVYLPIFFTPIAKIHYLQSPQRSPISLSGFLLPPLTQSGIIYVPSKQVLEVMRYEAESKFGQHR